MGNGKGRRPERVREGPRTPDASESGQLCFNGVRSPGPGTVPYLELFLFSLPLWGKGGRVAIQLMGRWSLVE
jgi:hypothetical protein